jgi:SM-20-related protein
MTALEFATNIGLFVRPEFLPTQLCDAVCAHVSSAPREAGTILLGDEPIVDEHIRRTKHAVIPEAASRPIVERIKELAPEISRHFNVAVSGLRDLQFLRYDEGDFFGFHRDRDDTMREEPQRVRERRVSIVIFLNSIGDEPGSGGYGGGELQFYLPDAVHGHTPAKFTFPASQGSLVAFNPQILHQVLPVTHGHRYTIVTWFV